MARTAQRRWHQVIRQREGDVAIRSDDRMAREPSEKSGTMSLGGLIFVGIGGIIGAGFFLGVGLSIQQAGPGILIGFLLGALVMSQVLGAITSLAVNHPVKGSFRTYAEEMFGPFIGYFQGWLYWLSSLLTVGSEAIAMAVFARVWVPHWPVWLLAVIFTALVVLLNAFGVKAFTKLESILAGFKIVALIGFIAVIALLALSIVGGGGIHPEYLTSHGGFLPHGFGGVMQSMLIVIFAYAGIGVVATAATELRQPRDAGKAGVWVVLGLFIIYVCSLAGLLVVVPWWQISTATSPFVFALHTLHYTFLADLFNAIILVAAFSVMAGALFSALLILRSLAAAGEAPKVLGGGKGKKSVLGLAVTALVAFIGIGVSYLLPSQVYNYLISAASYFTFFNWVVILLAWRRYEKRQGADASLFRSAWLKLGPFSLWLTVLAIMALALFSLGDASQRMGAIAAVGLALIVAAPYPFFVRKHKVRRPSA